MNAIAQLEPDTRRDRSTRRHGRQASLAALREQAEQIVCNEISFIANRSFARGDEFAQSDAEVFARLEARSIENADEPPPGLPAHLACLCAGDLLTADEEKSLFRRMNYLRFRANQVRVSIDPENPKAAEIREFRRLIADAMATRNLLITSNLRLVVSIVRKFVTADCSFDDLLSEGNLALLSAVEKFDFDRGFRFSTYAYRAVSRSLFRMISNRRKEMSRPGSSDPALAESLEDLSRPEATDREEQRQREILGELVQGLDRRERLIVRSRFALGAHRQRRTCRDLAQRLGISKERVRQLEQRAISKLMGMASEQPVAEVT